MLLFAAILGGVISVGAYKVTEKTPGGFSFSNGSFKTYPASYDIKSVTVPSFDFADVSEAVTPTVVHIKVKINQATSENDEEGQQQQMIPFGPFGGFQFHNMPQGPEEASGSGVIISSDGYIVTNNHVVKGADNIEVILADKKSYKADVVGTDPSTDIALIKIKADGLSPIKFGNSDNVRVGQWALAVGNPFNLTSTVTAGIISAKGRNIDLLHSNYKIESFIQTDAAVNPGNSGGALVNTQGELIGINTAIASENGQYAGYAFAVPVNIVKKVVDDIKDYGEVQRGFIGVTIQDVDSKLADDKGLSKVAGVYVNGLMEGGAAEDAGIKKGDVILKADSKQVNSVAELQELVSSHKPGDKINVLIDRNGKEKDIDVILKNKDGKLGKVVSENTEIKKSLGAEFEMLGDGDKSKLQLDNGVKVASVGKGKLREAGIPEGFIITKIDRAAVFNSNDIYRILEDKKGGVLVEGYLPSGEKKYYGMEM